MEKPEFISDEVYASDFTRNSLDKLFRVSNMKVTSFISKCELLGSPISYRSPKRHEGFSVHAIRVYSCSEVISRAFSDGFDIFPTQTDELRRTEEQLRGEIELLRKELFVLQKKRDNFISNLEFDSLASKLGLSKLYREEEIVNSKLAYKGSSGVYFLIKDDCVVYVGQSVNIFGRIASHVQYKDFDSYAYVICPKDKLDVLESLYIHTLSPPLQGKNSHGTGYSAPIGLSRLLDMSKNAKV
jgi:hypothetical protein